MIVLLISCHHDCIVSSWSQWTSCSRWVDLVAFNIIFIHNIIDLQSHFHRNQNHLFPIPSKTCLPLTSLGVQSRSRRIVQAAIAPHGLCPPEKVPQIMIRIRMMATLWWWKPWRWWKLWRWLSRFLNRRRSAPALLRPASTSNGWWGEEEDIGNKILVQRKKRILFDQISVEKNVILDSLQGGRRLLSEVGWGESGERLQVQRSWVEPWWLWSRLWLWW